VYRRGALSLGAVYHSSSPSELKGRYKPLNPTLAFLGTIRPGSGLPPAQAAELDLNLPWRLQLGARYALTDRLAVEFDRIKIKSRTTGRTLFSEVSAWKDTNAYLWA